MACCCTFRATDTPARYSGATRVADKVLGWLLIAIGCMHNFIAAPLTYSALTEPALWFVTAGLALWYAGFINVVRASEKAPSLRLCAFSAITNVTLLGFVLAFASLSGNWTDPPSVALIVTVSALTYISIRSLTRAWSAP